MAKPFNLDAVVAEATGEPFRFVFGGDTYEMSPQPDIITARLLQTGQLVAGFERLLGAEQWERLVAASEVLDMPRLVALFEAYADHLGIDLGESEASSSSSKSTARPSKRTSPATSKSR